MSFSLNGVFKSDLEVNISHEDQLNINIFARLNSKLEDLKEELKQKQNELKNLEEAANAVELITDDKIPFLVGKSFFFQNAEDTQKCLAENKEKIQKDIDEIDQKCAGIKKAMSDLKTELYAKFGNHINLETEDD